VTGVIGHWENQAGSKDARKRTLQGRQSIEGGLLQLPIRIEKDLARRQRPEDLPVRVGRSLPRQWVREALGEPPVLQNGHSVHLQWEVGVPPAESVLEVPAVRLEKVALLEAAVVGAAEAAAKGLGRAGQKEDLRVLFFLFFQI
jgi:hypothetical protein